MPTSTQFGTDARNAMYKLAKDPPKMDEALETRLLQELRVKLGPHAASERLLYHIRITRGKLHWTVNSYFRDVMVEGTTPGVPYDFQPKRQRTTAGGPGSGGLLGAGHSEPTQAALTNQQQQQQPQQQQQQQQQQHPAACDQVESGAGCETASAAAGAAQAAAASGPASGPSEGLKGAHGGLSCADCTDNSSSRGHLGALPMGVLEDVLAHCRHPGTLCAAACTSRAMREAAHSDVVWEQLFVARWGRTHFPLEPATATAPATDPPTTAAAAPAPSTAASTTSTMCTSAATTFSNSHDEASPAPASSPCFSTAAAATAAAPADTPTAVADTAVAGAPPWSVDPHTNESGVTGGIGSEQHQHQLPRHHPQLLQQHHHRSSSSASAVPSTVSLPATSAAASAASTAPRPQQLPQSDNTPHPHPQSPLSPAAALSTNPSSTRTPAHTPCCTHATCACAPVLHESPSQREHAQAALARMPPPPARPARDSTCGGAGCSQLPAVHSTLNSRCQCGTAHHTAEGPACSIPASNSMPSHKSAVHCAPGSGTTTPPASAACSQSGCAAPVLTTTASVAAPRAADAACSRSQCAAPVCATSASVAAPHAAEAACRGHEGSLDCSQSSTAQPWPTERCHTTDRGRGGTHRPYVPWIQLYKQQASFVTHSCCPLCGAGRVVPIVYGYPSSQLLQGMRRLQLILGGDHLIEDCHCWACCCCNASFRSYPYENPTLWMKDMALQRSQSAANQSMNQDGPKLPAYTYEL